MRAKENGERSQGELVTTKRAVTHGRASGGPGEWEGAEPPGIPREEARPSGCRMPPARTREHPETRGMLIGTRPSGRRGAGSVPSTRFDAQGCLPPLSPQNSPFITMRQHRLTSRGWSLDYQ
ncbi:hypothetical protein GCM10027073_31480 [Streptomyces chlorus]